MEIQETVGVLLRKHKRTLATAESCTGGLIGHLLTNIPGSSEYYIGGAVAYTYGAKTILLGITQEAMLEHSSVSEPVAREMARSIRRVLRADIGLSVTGIAGPDGGTPGKPVGLTFIGLSAEDHEEVLRFVWNGDRLANKQSSAEAALQMVLAYLERL